MRRLVAILVLLTVLGAVSPATSTPDPTLAMVAAIRAARGDNLPLSPVLTANAQLRAAQLVTDFSHAGAGVPGLWWGEIIAWNGYPAEYEIQGVMDAWLASGDHRAILLGNWTAFGVAFVYSGGHWYWAAEFGRPWPGVVPHARIDVPPPPLLPHITPPVTST